MNADNTTSNNSDNPSMLTSTDVESIGFTTNWWSGNYYKVGEVDDFIDDVVYTLRMYESVLRRLQTSLVDAGTANNAGTVNNNTGNSATDVGIGNALNGITSGEPFPSLLGDNIIGNRDAQRDNRLIVDLDSLSTRNRAVFEELLHRLGK